MKYFYQLLILVLICSCTRNDEEKTTCYSYINGTDRNIDLEFYSYNSGQFVSQSGLFSQNGVGVLNQKCDSDVIILSPITLYRFGSVVVKFDNTRKLTFKTEFGGQDDEFFFTSFYQREGNTLNFSYAFTEEDYNNAMPY